MEKTFATKINSLSNQLKELKAKCQDNPMMETLESSTTHSATPDSSVTVLSFADELSDREWQRKKLILYNVPEHTSTQSHKGFFIDLCKTVYDMNVLTTKVFCLNW